MTGDGGRIPEFSHRCSWNAGGLLTLGAKEVGRASLEILEMALDERQFRQKIFKMPTAIFCRASAGAGFSAPIEGVCLIPYRFARPEGTRARIVTVLVS